MLYEGIMSNFEWVKFRNKVPAAFKERCRGFDLEIPIERGYRQARKRVLVIIGKVPTKDLSDGRLLGSESNGLEIMERVLTEAKKWGSNFGDVEAFRTAFINFNFFKNYHLSDDAYASSLKVKHNRIKRYVKKLKPHVIIVFGDEAMSVIQPSAKNAQFRRGSVFDADLRSKAKIVSTIEWDAMMAGPKDSGRSMIDKGNLLGFAFRTISHGLLGKHPLSLKHVKARPVHVKTLKQYKRMMRLMRKSKAVAVDTETGGLQVYNNRIATIQFANSAKKGYVVILDHADSPFTAKEIRYIKKDLQKFFAEEHNYRGEKTRYLIIHNAKFDLQIVRMVLKLPIVLWPVWDTIAGEFCLDENLNGLIGSKTPAFNLAHMFARYDNDFYYTSEFSKSDRHLLAENPITQKELRYCFHPDTDVVTDKGRVNIVEVAANPCAFKALSFNHATGHAEYKDITASSEIMPDEDMVELDYEGGTLCVTASHEVWSETRRTYVKAIDIEEGETILSERPLP